MTTMLGAVILGAPQAADAGFTLTLRQSGYADKIVTDDVAASGDNSATTPGFINFSSTYGDFFIQATFGSSNSLSEQIPATLSITSMSISFSGGTPSGPLQLILEDTGFKAPGAMNVVMQSQLSSTMLPVGSSVTFQSFLDGDDGTLLSLNSVDGAVANDSVTISGTPYTLKNVTTISMSQSGIVNTTGVTSVAPVPSSALLALAGLPVLGGFSWLRRRKVSTAS
jgi:hypothetical protein